MGRSWSRGYQARKREARKPFPARPSAPPKTHEEIRADMKAWAQARTDGELARLIHSSVGLHRFTKDQAAVEVAKIIAAMREHGDCVWHAAARVSGTACWCSECRPDERKA